MRLTWGLGAAWRGIKNPHRTLDILKDNALEWNGRVYGALTDACSVLDEDWDTLIILDACRYDLYESVSSLDGDLQSRISAGSSSAEFISENFAERQAHDTVYLSANPYANQLEPGAFHAIENLYLSEWDEQIETVHPKNVVQAAVAAHHRWPKKRHIVHFMQPHYPFLGERGQQIEHRGFNADSVEGTTDIPNVWERLAQGELSREAVWEAYTENLELVLKHVADLLDSIEGRIVITSDHGNLIGDVTYPIPVRGFDHPAGVHVKQLVKVPWHIIEKDTRRDVISEPPERKEPTDEKTIQDRLEALGYR